MLWSISFILPSCISILEHDRLKRFSKFLENDSLICIGIKSSDNSNQLLITGEMAMASLESLYVSVIEKTFIGDINSIENSQYIPIMTIKKMLFHQFEF